MQFALSMKTDTCLQDTLVLAPRDTQYISLYLKPVSVQLFIQFEQILKETGTLRSVVIAQAARHLSLCLCSWAFEASASQLSMTQEWRTTERLSDICVHWNFSKLQVNLDFEVLILRNLLSSFNKINYGGEFVLLWVVSDPFVCGPCPYHWCRGHWRTPLQVS